MTSASNFFIKKMKMSNRERRLFDRKKRQELRGRILTTLSPQDSNSIRERIKRIKLKRYGRPKERIKRFKKYRFSTPKLRVFRRRK